MINQKLSPLYQWKMDQDTTSLVVEFPFPEETPFNPDIIKINLNKEKCTLIVTIPDEKPFIQGTLYKKCNSFTTRTGPHSFFLTLVKDDSEEWPYLIGGWDPDEKAIDPKSGFDLFVFARKSQNPEMIQQAYQFFDSAISSGYVPALLLGYEVSIKNPESRNFGMKLLKIAAYHYQDVTAMLKLGCHYELEENEKNDAFELFSQAARKGAYIGMSLMGQMISPLSEISFYHKDAKEAAQLFEAVLENDPDEITSLYEFSKLLYHGVGIEENKERALEMYEKAKQAEPKLPPIDIIRNKENKEIEKTPNSFFTPFGIVVIASCLSFAAASGFLIFRFFKKRKK